MTEVVCDTALSGSGLTTLEVGPLTMRFYTVPEMKVGMIVHNRAIYALASIGDQIDLIYDKYLVPTKLVCKRDPDIIEVETKTKKCIDWLKERFGG